tara:strand:+ start:1654 stop:2553 length:900 start_codon:yes stop_codon:yes gene_type:complete
MKYLLFTCLASGIFGTVNCDNKEYIKNMNLNSKNGVIYEENKFINHTIQEFDRLYKGLKNKYLTKTSNCLIYEGDDNNYLPESWDWRDRGAVTSVKDQGKCGSCWSFSAAGCLEGAWAVSTNLLYNFSEQQLMDCSRFYGNMACHGGLMESAFEYAIDVGMCTDEEVPYIAEDEFCKNSVKNCNKVAHFSNCYNIPENNELKLKEAVFMRPVAVSIEADTNTFQFYKGGILDSTNCGTQLDHGVLVVGYGVEDEKKYWIVKNSWGSNWGEDGYVRIARGDSENSEGVCGIAKDASFVFV